MKILKLVEDLVVQFPQAGWYVLDLGGPVPSMELLDWVKRMGSQVANAEGTLAGIPVANVIIVTDKVNAYPLFVSHVSTEDAEKAWEMAIDYGFLRRDKIQR